MLTPELKKELIEKQYLRESIHPNGELFLYNYSELAQFDKEAFKLYPILKYCRGLVLDIDGNVIARGFEKFWNYEEYGIGSALGELPPYNSFTITDKVDGSLGIVFNYKGELIVATRGSFVSDQAKWAKEWLDNRGSDFISNGHTFLFEILYPENRIVVDYDGYKGLVLLSVINTLTGEEADRNTLEQNAEAFAIDVVKYFDGITDFKTIREQLPRDNAEGFVIRFDNGLRVKMKYEEYVRLHRLLTCTSTRTIWENLRAGKEVIGIIEGVPDEFHSWVDEVIKSLKSDFYAIVQRSHEAYTEIDLDWPRKQQAEYILDKYKPFRSVIFKMLDGKPYEDLIWKMIEPEYEKPFKGKAVEKETCI